VKTARPGVIVSAAVIPDAQQAFTSRLQDWRGWLDQSLLDVICPMAYTTEPETFQKQIAALAHMQGRARSGRGLAPTSFRRPDADAHRRRQQDRCCRHHPVFVRISRRAANGADSVSELGRAAFGTAPE
jgi:uncharacterized lipoprotein YddW (UPF0748 family)